jgi:hypothetical protein
MEYKKVQGKGFEPMDCFSRVVSHSYKTWVSKDMFLKKNKINWQIELKSVL